MPYEGEVVEPRNTFVIYSRFPDEIYQKLPRKPKAQVRRTENQGGKDPLDEIMF